MFKPNTVLVLGAAMSAEVGMPLGENLKAKVANVLPHQNSGNDCVRDALFVRGDRILNIPACAAVRSALPKAASIDNLIEHRGHNPNFKQCAKVGIVAAVIDAERSSQIYRRPGQAVGSIAADGSTYAALFRLMVGNVSTKELAQAIARVRIVNFNYDRCLEHYFHDWLVGYSGLDQADAWALVDQLKVVRPYGWIGPLARMVNPDPRAVPFGAVLDGLDLSELANNILTFSEERDKGLDKQAKEITAGAEQLIFLGCAYHPQNLKLLQPEGTLAESVYGTCYLAPPEDKLSAPDLDSFSAPTRQAFERALKNWAASQHLPRPGPGRSVRFESLTCRQLTAKFGAEWLDIEFA